MIRKTARRSVRSFVALAGTLPVLAAHCAAHAETKLIASTVAPYDISGFAVGVSHNIAVLGAPLDDTPQHPGDATGSAAVFRFNGIEWVQEKTLLSPTPHANDRFGGAVSIDGDLIAVSSLFSDTAATDAGAVHLFRFNGAQWVFETTLLAPDASAFDQFGWSICVDGDRVVVGARWDDDRGLDAGAAYVFHREGGVWTVEAKLTADDGGPYDHFGAAVALSGDHVIIGAPQDDPFGWGAGSAYAFSLSDGAWFQHEKLRPADSASSAEFGTSVDIDGDMTIIGAWGDDQNGWDAGAAYVFQRDEGLGGWLESTKLLASGGVGGDLFGCAVSIEGDNILVGAPNAGSHGAAVRYHRQVASWNEMEVLTATADGAPLGFGYSVSLDDTAYLAGAPYENISGSESGCAYVFTLIDPLFADLNADGAVNSLDLGILLGAWGVAGGPADLNGDGLVDPADLALMLGAWSA
jgi:hypothetical protein